MAVLGCCLSALCPVVSAQEGAVECCEEGTCLGVCGARALMHCVLFLFHSFVSSLVGRLRRLLGLHQLSFNLVSLNTEIAFL